jgi:hypothetical protein
VKKIVLATSEPSANYHFASFDEKHAANLVHLIPSVGDVQGKTLVATTEDMNVIDDAALVVLIGGTVSEWTRHVGFMANEAGVPLVFSELAYVPSEAAGFYLPEFEAFSAVSPYGVFNMKGFFDSTDMDVTVTGHPFLDNLPEYAPQEKRILVLSSLFKKDSGVELRKSIKALSDNGYNVIVRPHPREKNSDWEGFNLSTEQSLIRDLAMSEAMIGVPGTGFIAAAALGVPSLAIEGSTLDTTLPEFKYIFRYVHANEIVGAVTDIPALDEVAGKFLTGPVGVVGNHSSSDRLVEFWNSHTN